MKTKNYILVLLIALSCAMCNSPKKDNKEAVSTEKTSKPDNDKHVVLTPADSLKMVNHSIEVKGDVENQLQLTVDSLKKMKVATIDDFKVVCQSGEVKKDNKVCKGVLLRDILEKAKIKQNGHKDRNFYIVARASDDYKATFSWAEIFNNPTGDNAYILFEENGKPVKNGEMIAICKNDIKTGPRHVYWLKSIEVYKVK
ncbi:molybdopterin-dependent oxidoreductase-like protein [Flavobacterium cutihirudinis]|uniref:Molybdopterin-dependent oxidoreductase-like protein n=1 Tax=Flavobacterium cutihirudinis TaxID=1265740 RepID=A0A3D9FUW5_9FLAO|nr:molybdopterin-dependent oxidoreductase [Flavobacterium cutihirudinis]RED24559.1 molybdopterin-dependent oxidoreductase-like protein [Flavobacterium cutihirudinis]